MRHDHELFEREHTIDVKFESTHFLALVLNVALGVFDFISDLFGLHFLLDLILLMLSFIFEETFRRFDTELIDLVTDFIEVLFDKRRNILLL